MKHLICLLLSFISLDGMNAQVHIRESHEPLLATEREYIKLDGWTLQMHVIQKDSAWTVVARQENIVRNNNSITVLSEHGVRWMIQFTARVDKVFPPMGAKAVIVDQPRNKSLTVNGKVYDIISINKNVQ